MQRVERSVFGELNGKPIHLFRLSNANGMVAELLEFGGRIKVINGMKSSGKKRDNSGSIGRLLGGMCNSIAEYATKKEGIQPSFFAVVSLTLVNPF